MSPKSTGNKKRENGVNEQSSPSKKPKSDSDDANLQKKKNFVTACEIVSFRAYHDYRQKFHLIYLPPCVTGNCKHDTIKPIPDNVQESFKSNMALHAWCEYLDLCNIINPGQYLTANVLKDVVEIMMNAHEDQYASHTVNGILHRCQQILSHNFTTFPPCNNQELRQCYKDFLTAPMAESYSEFSNQKDYADNKGIFEYCLRRLLYEFDMNSKDGPIVDIDENTPEQFKQSIRGMHYQNEKFEIFETLHRLDRIKRLMAVLESINQLLQYDLAIWYSRKHIRKYGKRNIKPLMAIILWSNNELRLGGVTDTCRSIMKLFVYAIHLQYPKEYIRILATLLNTTIQTFYFSHAKSDSDYPSVNPYFNYFGDELNNIILGDNYKLPHQTVIDVLQKIQPFFMQFEMATYYLNNIYQNSQKDPMKYFIEFLSNKKWEKFPNRNEIPAVPEKPVFLTKNVINLTNFLIKECGSASENLCKVQDEKCKKFDPKLKFEEPLYQDQVIIIFYIALRAYIDAYSIIPLDETLDKINENVLDGALTVKNIKHDSCYYVTEAFIKNYRYIYLMLDKIKKVLKKLQSSGDLPKSFKIFEKLGLLSFDN